MARPLRTIFADFGSYYVSGCLTNPSWRSSTALSLQYSNYLLPAATVFPVLVLSASLYHSPVGHLRKQGALEPCPNTQTKGPA